MSVHFFVDEKFPDMVWLKFEGVWTVKDYEDAYNALIDHVENHPGNFYHIADFLESSAVPPNMLALAARATRRLPDNLVMVVAINSSRLVNSLIDVAAKLNRNLGSRTVGVRSVAEVYETVNRHRSQASSR